jgi:type IV pilus assembly protein PilY1
VLGDLQVRPTGTLLGDGLASTPAIVGASDGHEYKYITKTTGEIIKLLEGGGVNQLGLRSWRQLK